MFAYRQDLASERTSGTCATRSVQHVSSVDFLRAGYIELFAIESFPLIAPGDDLWEAFRRAINASTVSLQDYDIVVLTHKVISKSQGNTLTLEDVKSSPAAIELGRETGKDSRLVEVILRETRNLVRVSQRHIITEHLLGHIIANAGVDQSNSGGEGIVCLLPSNPDETARELCNLIHREYNKNVAVLVSDSQGRPFRKGTVGTCIGIHGIPPLLDLRGQQDLYGYTLKNSMECIGDEICSAANLLMGQGAEAVPVVIIRGFQWRAVDSTISTVLRSPEEDIFRS